MSDFLSQLADRALALPPLVRPRLPSIYEPPAASLLQDSLEEHIEVRAEPSRTIEPAHDQALQSGDEQAEAKQATPRPRAQGIDEKQRSEAVAQKPLREKIERKPAAAPERKMNPQPPVEQPVFTQQGAPPFTPFPGESESAGEIETAEPKTPPHRIARKQKLHLDRVPIAGARQPATPSEDTKAHSAKHLVESDLEIDARTTQKESAEPQFFSHESKHRVEKQAAQPVAVTVRSAQRPRSEQATPTLPLTPARRDGRPSVSAPAIRVTIGRVEVRAVMPPMATPKSESPPAPKLSLEDYLKQRNGGTRE
jgi:hypothetical protein